MSVADPNRPPSQLAQQCDQTFIEIEIHREQVERFLREVDIRKVTRTDSVSPHVLGHCSSELAGSLSEEFGAFVRENT